MYALYTYAAIPAPSSEKKFRLPPAQHLPATVIRSSRSLARAAYIHGTILYRYMFVCASALTDGRAS